MTGIGIGFWNRIAEADNQVYDLILTTIISYFSVSLIYALFGTTLGKEVCGIRICNNSGIKISRVDFFKRDIRIFLKGEWLCIPVLCAIGNLLQYNRITNGKDASYDEGREYKAYSLRDKKWYDTLVVILILIIQSLLKHIS